MMKMNGKRLLILGGTSASLDLVKNARQMGIYTIVTDPNQTGVAKEIADETALISTADIDGVVITGNTVMLSLLRCGFKTYCLSLDGRDIPPKG